MIEEDWNQKFSQERLSSLLYSYLRNNSCDGVRGDETWRALRVKCCCCTIECSRHLENQHQQQQKSRWFIWERSLWLRRGRPICISTAQSGLSSALQAPIRSYITPIYCDYHEVYDNDAFLPAKLFRSLDTIIEPLRLFAGVSADSSNRSLSQIRFSVWASYLLSHRQVHESITRLIKEQIRHELIFFEGDGG